MFEEMGLKRNAFVKNGVESSKYPVLLLVYRGISVSFEKMIVLS